MSILNLFRICRQLSPAPTALALLAILASASNAQGASDPQLSLAGHWTGTLIQQGRSLPVAFDFQRSTSGLAGSYSCVPQNCLQYPLDSVTGTASNIQFVLGGGMAFDGRLRPGRLSGTFQNGAAGGTFSLERTPDVPLPYQAEDMRFHNGNVTLAGTLCIPDTPGAHPAIVFMQGSGPETRWGTNRFWADRFARAGIAALCYDKRGCGASTGDWRTADFDDLAHDTIAAVRLLQARPDIDAKRIGLYGHSQGGFIAPLVASQCPEIALVIAADSPGGIAYAQDIYRVRAQLEDEGYSAKAIAKALQFLNLFITVARTGQGWKELDAATKKAQGEKWFDAVTPPPRGNWLWAWYRKTGDYDCRPYWAKTAAPTLLIYGERDRLVPPRQSAAAIQDALSKGANRDCKIVVLPGAVHNDTIQPKPGQRFFWWHTAPGLSEIQILWVKQHTSADK